MSEVLEETKERISGGHIVLLCKCHECGDTFSIQRRRFLKSKPCGWCVKKKQNAWKPMFKRIEELQKEILRLQELLTSNKISFQGDVYEEIS